VPHPRAAVRQFQAIGYAGSRALEILANRAYHRIQTGSNGTPCTGSGPGCAPIPRFGVRANDRIIGGDLRSMTAAGRPTYAPGPISTAEDGCRTGTLKVGGHPHCC
jgi:hypothetical protein